MKRVSLSILFLALLLLVSVASASNMVEKQNDNKASGEVDQDYCIRIFCGTLYCCRGVTYCCRYGTCCLADHTPVAKFMNPN